MNKQRQSVEILYKALNYESLDKNHDKRLVIIEPRSTTLISKSIGPFLSFEDLTAGDFYEIYRYKKSLEEDKNRKGKVIK